ncbi:transcription factor ORG2-like [Prunus yedoensis var. nudiflora]|uniref:Transcription factor ORG2-like n=1 Tax=Prunus yedoensis var. nudiflora TaxID=2094558 RepID=A0A314UI89_PRUYE|nr:transcription factor ORG2-like [Prunus yedoensis var. nudiflora]
MLALSPPLFSTVGWLSEDPIGYDQKYFYGDSAESFLHILPSQLPQFELDLSRTMSGDNSSGSTVAKKINHNASERERRKKINSLYSSMRSLLPADQAKKLSIPNTISHVLKYIPELQKQVEGLIRKREELLSRTCKQEAAMHEEKRIKSTARSSLSAVSTYRLSDRAVAIQISTLKTHNNLLSEILLNLEEEGLQVLNASSFQSSGGRVFYIIHLQVERADRLECENLSEKLRSFYA